MAARSFLSDLLGEITERGRRLIRPAREDGTPAEMVMLADQLLSGRGEASGVAIARQILDCYTALDGEGRLAFFTALAERYGCDHDRLAEAAAAFLETRGEADALALRRAAEGRRRELIRRLNLAPGGTAALVAMRADLLAHLRARPALASVDDDFEHLLATWFNRGFLVLQRIDWDTPASILERIIRYEAVHAIRDWDDLRNRIDRPDRRLYAFFHPALVDEPLIFVEVALSREVPDAIAPILYADTPLDAGQAGVATFYSISNCQAGLRGISFGNFLIKQVVDELLRELPGLKTFVTLSPAPGFRAWLARLRAEPDAPLSGSELKVLDLIDTPDWHLDPATHAEARRILMPLAARYFLLAKDAAGRPLDSVARFHLGNGARLDRLNWLGDPSAKGMEQSAGLMVNYLYEEADIEKNHEAFANDGVVAAAPAIRRLLRAEAPRKAVAAAG